jgi:WD40 repeat protein
MPSNPTYLLLNQNSDYFFSGHKGGLIISWDLESNKSKANLQAHKSEIKSLFIPNINKNNNGITNNPNNSNNSNYLASGSADGKIKFWDIRGKNQFISIKGHLGNINCVTISPDLNYLISSANDNLTKIWDLRQNKLIKDINMENYNVNCIEFIPNINPNQNTFNIAYALSDKSVKIFDIEKYEILSSTPMDKLPAVKLAFDNTGKDLIIATNEGFKYFIFDKNKNKEKPEFLFFDMFEAGFNNLQDINYIQDEGLYGK